MGAVKRAPPSCVWSEGGGRGVVGRGSEEHPSNLHFSEGGCGGGFEWVVWALFPAFVVVMGGLHVKTRLK